MFSKTLNIVQALCYILIIIGAINWGLIGFFHINLVEALFGADTLATRVVYGIVGIAAIISLILTIKYTLDNKEY